MKGNNIVQITLILTLLSWITGIIFCQHCPVTVQFNRNYLDKRLFGSGYAVTTTANYSLHKCARTCARHGWCRSFNFGREFGFCEMNSINASEASGNNLLTDTNWDYYDVDKWLELITASCTANTCPATHRCLHGGSSPWCIKIEDSILETCPDEWYPFNGTCYSVSFEVTTKEGSNSACDESEANLAKVINDETLSFMKEIRSNIEQGIFMLGVRSIRIDTDVTTYKVFYRREAESYTYTYTQEQENWIWLHQTGVDIKRRYSILMHINSCVNASLALSTTTESIENGTYRIDVLYGSTGEPATTIYISKYHDGNWLLLDQGNLTTYYLLGCGAGWGNLIRVSWLERRLSLELATGDELSVPIQEDFGYLAVSRVTDIIYRFLYDYDEFVIVNGTDGECARLSGYPCASSSSYRYMCEKPAMVKIDGI